MTKMTARYLVILTLCAITAFCLITLLETNLQQRLDFGIAAGVVIPMLLAARSCGAAWVDRAQRRAGFKTICGYGIWFALLAVVGFGLALVALIRFQLISALDDLGPEPFLTHPLTSLAMLGLALGTGTLITSVGFSLGSRAATRLLPFPAEK